MAKRSDRTLLNSHGPTVGHGSPYAPHTATSASLQPVWNSLRGHTDLAADVAVHVRYLPVVTSRDEQQIQLVDEHNQPIGGIRRGDALPSGANFRTVHVLICNGRGDLLLQQKPTGLRNAGQWGSSVAGYVMEGESYPEAVQRKLRTELGVTGAEPLSLGITEMADGNSRKFVGVYLLRWDGPITPNPADFAALSVVPPANLHLWSQTHSAVFTATTLQVLRFARPQLGIDPGL